MGSLSRPLLKGNPKQVSAMERARSFLGWIRLTFVLILGFIGLVIFGLPWSPTSKARPSELTNTGLAWWVGLVLLVYVVYQMEMAYIQMQQQDEMRKENVALTAAIKALAIELKEQPKVPASISFSLFRLAAKETRNDSEEKSND